MLSGRKSLVAPSADAGAPAPHAGGGAASPGDSTDRTRCGVEDAPKARRQERDHRLTSSVSKTSHLQNTP
jgi:hypothetical protein